MGYWEFGSSFGSSIAWLIDDQKLHDQEKAIALSFVQSEKKCRTKSGFTSIVVNNEPGKTDWRLKFEAILDPYMCEKQEEPIVFSKITILDCHHEILTGEFTRKGLAQD